MLLVVRQAGFPAASGQDMQVLTSAEQGVEKLPGVAGLFSGGQVVEVVEQQQGRRTGGEALPGQVGEQGCQVALGCLNTPQRQQAGDQLAGALNGLAAQFVDAAAEAAAKPRPTRYLGSQGALADAAFLGQGDHPPCAVSPPDARRQGQQLVDHPGHLAPTPHEKLRRAPHPFGDERRRLGLGRLIPLGGLDTEIPTLFRKDELPAGRKGF